MKPFNTHMDGFCKWWEQSGKPEHASSNLEGLWVESFLGWLDCFIRYHPLTNYAAEVRGKGPYCTGWNAAVDFMLKEKSND